MERLRELDKVAFVRFASVYRDFKDVDQFMATLKGLLEGPGTRPVRSSPPASFRAGTRAASRRSGSRRPRRGRGGFTRRSLTLVPFVLSRSCSDEVVVLRPDRGSAGSRRRRRRGRCRWRARGPPRVVLPRERGNTLPAAPALRVTTSTGCSRRRIVRSQVLLARYVETREDRGGERPSSGSRPSATGYSALPRCPRLGHVPASAVARQDEASAPPRGGEGRPRSRGAERPAASGGGNAAEGARADADGGGAVAASAGRRGGGRLRRLEHLAARSSAGSASNPGRYRPLGELGDPPQDALLHAPDPHAEHGDADLPGRPRAPSSRTSALPLVAAVRDENDGAARARARRAGSGWRRRARRRGRCSVPRPAARPPPA